MADPVFEPSLPLVAVQGENVLLPLLLNMEACHTPEHIFANIEATRRRGYVPFNDLLDSQSGTLSICGAGPSLRETYKELDGDILSSNSALGFLLEHDIVPKYQMIFDGDEICERFAIPHPEISYLIASRCHEKVFQRLKDCNVVVWHALGDGIADWLAERNILEPMIAGGSCCVTRALYLGPALGYRSMIVYGADSSYAQDGSTHVLGKSLVPEKDLVLTIGNQDGSRWFRSTPEWASQVEEFKMIYANALNYDIKIEVKGDGMLPHAWRLMKESYEKAAAEELAKNPDVHINYIPPEVCIART